MSPYYALNFAANEILAMNESLPVVVLDTHDGIYVNARTQGDYVQFRANLHSVGDVEEFAKHLSHVAALLTADESACIPDLSLAVTSVRVCVEHRLRPNALPVFNGEDKTVWPEIERYRH